MKNRILLLVFPILELFASGFQPAGVEQHMTGKSVGDTSANHTVVELFTSEGCSSCPAADKVLAGIASEYQHKIIVLGFHVDYWNRLGWKDRFSDASYSERQQQYAAALPSGEVYTPQAIVNGEEQMVGSDKNRLLTSININKNISGPIYISLLATQQKGEIIVDYAFNARPGHVLNIALLQVDAVSDVLTGENKGLKLHHINIVRDFTTLSNPLGKTKLRLPEKSLAKDYRVVGYVQEKKSMRIAGATDYVPIQ